jgi:hypothetical protein
VTNDDLEIKSHSSIKKTMRKKQRRINKIYRAMTISAYMWIRIWTFSKKTGKQTEMSEKKCLRSVAGYTRMD